MELEKMPKDVREYVINLARTFSENGYTPPYHLYTAMHLDRSFIRTKWGVVRIHYTDEIKHEALEGGGFRTDVYVVPLPMEQTTEALYGEGYLDSLNWRNLEAGRLLDALIAHIEGWSYIREKWSYISKERVLIGIPPNERGDDLVPYYSTEPDAALHLIRALEKGVYADLSYRGKPAHWWWYCEFFRFSNRLSEGQRAALVGENSRYTNINGDDKITCGIASAPTESMAIVKAWLDWKTHPSVWTHRKKKELTNG